MITNLEITNFKCIDNSSFELAGLTILTGKNSTGKSSVTQSILLACQYTAGENLHSMQKLTSPFSKFSEIRNKHVNAKSLSVSITLESADDSTSNILFNMREDATKCNLTPLTFYW
jgi:predicted ATPase